MKKKLLWVVAVLLVIVAACATIDGLDHYHLGTDTDAGDTSDSGGDSSE